MRSIQFVYLLGSAYTRRADTDRLLFSVRARVARYLKIAAEYFSRPFGWVATSNVKKRCTLKRCCCYLWSPVKTGTVKTGNETLEDDRTVLYKNKSLDGTKPKTNPTVTQTLILTLTLTVNCFSVKTVWSCLQLLCHSTLTSQTDRQADDIVWQKWIFSCSVPLKSSLSIIGIGAFQFRLDDSTLLVYGTGHLAHKPTNGKSTLGQVKCQTKQLAALQVP